MAITNESGIPMQATRCIAPCDFISSKRVQVSHLVSAAVCRNGRGQTQPSSDTRRGSGRTAFSGRRALLLLRRGLGQKRSRHSAVFERRKSALMPSTRRPISRAVWYLVTVTATVSWSVRRS